MPTLHVPQSGHIHRKSKTPRTANVSLLRSRKRRSTNGRVAQRQDRRKCRRKSCSYKSIGWNLFQTIFAQFAASKVHQRWMLTTPKSGCGCAHRRRVEEDSKPRLPGCRWRVHRRVPASPEVGFRDEALQSAHGGTFGTRQPHGRLDEQFGGHEPAEVARRVPARVHSAFPARAVRPFRRNDRQVRL